MSIEQNTILSDDLAMYLDETSKTLEDIKRDEMGYYIPNIEFGKLYLPYELQRVCEEIIRI